MRDRNVLFSALDPSRVPLFSSVRARFEPGSIDLLLADRGFIDAD